MKFGLLVSRSKNEAPIQLMSKQTQSNVIWHQRQQTSQRARAIPTARHVGRHKTPHDKQRRDHIRYHDGLDAHALRADKRDHVANGVLNTSRRKNIDNLAPLLRGRAYLRGSTRATRRAVQYLDLQHAFLDTYHRAAMLYLSRSFSHFVDATTIPLMKGDTHAANT